MQKTASGIDEFKISWQSYLQTNIPKKKYIDTHWTRHEIKKEEESLADFFKNNSDEFVIFPKYFINGVDIALWFNLHDFQESILDEPGHYINSLYLFHQSGEAYLPSLKLALYTLLGNKIDLDILRKLGFDVDRTYSKEYHENFLKHTGIDFNKVKFDWVEFVEEGNRYVPLYWTGDRRSGGFYAIIKKEYPLIKWDLPGYVREFTFEFDQYKKEFQEFMDLIDFQPELV